MVEPLNKQPPDENGWPKFGRDLMDREHAVYVIATTLDALKLGNWTHTLVTWLGNYDGLETILPEEHDPLICVRSLLGQYMLRKVEIGRIAVDLCSQPFLRHRAAWVDVQGQTRRNWHPLKQPWLEFIDQHEPGEELRVWEGENAFPDPEELRLYLLGGYVRQNGLR